MRQYWPRCITVLALFGVTGFAADGDWKLVWQGDFNRAVRSRRGSRRCP